MAEEGVEERRRVLVFGATGYLGKHMVKASVAMGHPTSVYVRPIQPPPSRRLLYLQALQAMGVTVFYGELEEEEKVVEAVKQVDVVISTLAVPQHLDQLKIIAAIKRAPHIQRFVPSEYGNDADRTTALPPFQSLLENKKKVRRATEAAGIPYTYISGNSFAAYFVNYLLRPADVQTVDHLTVYGSGRAKAVLNLEEDVAAYTVMAAMDPRAENRVVVVRPPENTVSQMDLITWWEQATGRSFSRRHVPDEELVKLAHSVAFPENVPPAILHSIFVKGDQTCFQLIEGEDVEASVLYPNHPYTPIRDFLHTCVSHAPPSTLASFI